MIISTKLAEVFQINVVSKQHLWCEICGNNFDTYDLQCKKIITSRKCKHAIPLNAVITYNGKKYFGNPFRLKAT